MRRAPQLKTIELLTMQSDRSSAVFAHVTPYWDTANNIPVPLIFGFYAFSPTGKFSDDVVVAQNSTNLVTY